MLPCIFCDIIEGKAPGQVYYEDQQMVVLKDIHPVNAFHLLAISKEHIRSERDLLPKHRGLVKKLIDNGTRVMSQLGADVDDIICGFHRDPFLTVYHLHLHFVSPSTNLYFDEGMYGMFPSAFISGEDVLTRLEKEAREENVGEEGQQINSCNIDDNPFSNDVNQDGGACDESNVNIFLGQF